MKLSVSLPDGDVAFLDEYAASEGLPSRSAALARAVRLLRGLGLTEAYERAFDEWEDSGEAALWEATVADGLGGDAPG